MPERGPVPDAMARTLLHGYYAAVSYTDAQIGRILAELDRQGLREHTIVIVWGDHGWHLGDHGMWSKHTAFEQATRVPLIVSAPGFKPAGRRPEALVEFVDIYPTLCELAGLPLPEGLEGASFVPVLRRPDRAWKRACFSQWPKQIPGQGRGVGHSLRTERYRLTEWTVPGKPFRAVELYDYRRDPEERENLAARPEHRGRVRRLTEALRAGGREALPIGSR